MSDTFSYEDASKPAPATNSGQTKTFTYEEAAGETQPRGLKGWAKDVAATAVKGAIGIPEAVVGLADIPTGGAVGKFLENEGGAVGFRPKQAREIVNDWHSDATKEAQRKFQAADGVVGKTVAALENPSNIVTAVGESIPSMLAGGAVARGVLAAAPRVAPWLAGAIGEGVAGAGSAAEQIRQETKDGLLSPEQAGLAAATGVATTAFGALGGKVANRLGIGEADTMLAQGMKGLKEQSAEHAARMAASPVARSAEQSALRSIPTKVLQGAISEGFLEELPQSVAEQILQNLALDKPWSEDVDASAVMGVLSGGAMGGAASGFRAFHEASAKPGAQATTGTEAPKTEQSLQLGYAPSQMVVFPDGTVGTQAEVDAYVNGLPEEQRMAARAQLLNLGAQPADPAQPQQTNSGTQRLKTEALARLREVQQQEQGEPDVPQSTPPDGAAVLAQQQAAVAARRQAEQDASRAVESPDDEILQSTGVTERPSAAMGLNGGPTAGSLENAAALAVDTGAHQQMRQASLLDTAAQVAEEDAKKSGNAKKGETALASQQADPETGELPQGAHLAQWSDAELRDAFKAAQVSGVRRQLAVELARRRMEREQKALQAELQADQNAMESDQPDSGFAAVREDAGPVPAEIQSQTTTQGAPIDGQKANQTQQGRPQRAQAPGAQGDADAAPAGLNNGSAETQSDGAKAAPQADPKVQTQNGQVEALREQLRGVEEKILRAAPDAMGVGGGDIESAMKSRKVPVTLKAARKKLQGQLRDAQAALPRQGKVGEMLGSGEVVLTSSGRATSPFPNVSTDTSRKAVNTMKAVDQWLMQNALDEARLRNDGFNARQFESALNKPQQADKDSAEQYLFGEQPAVPRQILKPLGERDQAQQVSAAAHEAATSPKNDLPEPTEAQKEAGNYAKGHVRLNGHDISIENPAGSRRRPEWPPLKNHYGYFKGSVGADKDHVDVFMTDRAHDPDLPVFVVDQMNKDGSFDEHKVVMGAANEADARQTYLGNYEKGWTGLGAITQMSQDEFKAWVRDPAKTKLPASGSKARERPTTGPGSEPHGDALTPDAARAAAIDYMKWLKAATPADVRPGVHGGYTFEGGSGAIRVKVGHIKVDGQDRLQFPIRGLLGEVGAVEPVAPPARKPRGVLAKKAEADAKARADYFTPGNVVKGYSGHDRVISYRPPDENGRWSVTVRAVEKQGDTWVDKASERERVHATPPDARELKAGPVERAPSQPTESAGELDREESRSPPKPRLGETADAVWAAIKQAAGGVISREGGSRLLYPTLRVVAGDSFRIDVNGDLQVVDRKSGGVGVRPATSAEADEFHRDLNGDRVEVLLMTAPGYGSAYGHQKVVQVLHSPSGMSFEQSRQERQPAERAEPAPQQAPASEASAPAPETTKSSESKTPTLDAHSDLMKRVRDGKATADEFKAGFAQADAGHDALIAELSTMTKERLLKAGGYFFYHRYRTDKKGDIVAALANRVLDEYAMGRSYGPSSYVMTAGGLAAHRKAQDAALRELVANTTDEDIQKHSQEVAAARAEAAGRKEAEAKTLANPETLADFRAVMRHHIAQGDDRQAAFLRLTPEQRARYDELEAASTKDAREAAKSKLRSQVATAGQLTTGQVIETKHTQKGHDLFVVQLAERVSREDYDTLNASAKRMGGSYSSYRGNGAVPGFQFRTRDAAEAFGKLVAGDSADAQAVAQARRDAFDDDRSQSAVERLGAMADALNDRADESLTRERKANTDRRARMAASADASARADKALAGTMKNLAQAIESGKAKFLDAVRQKVQVEFLASELRNAKDAQIRAKYPTYGEQERHRGEPVDAETVDFSNFPSYTAMRSDLAALGRQMMEVDGTKKLGARLMSVADDVSDAYTEWAKANLLQVSRFGRAGDLAEFSSKDDAERAIRRSGIADKAIVLPIKRGQNRVVLAPSEAMKLGLWQGDGDKRITLSGDFGQELVQAVGRRANGAVRLPWVLESTFEKRKRLSGMGIQTAAEYRAALREFADIQEAIATPDKIKEMERAMIGRRSDGLDFFPTSAEVVDSMLAAAEIGEGMAVLEPSAGMGHIADAIREQVGVAPDVVELSGERRELLEAKGYNLVGTDFTEMKPRTGFTYGDVFRDTDGRLGVMRGSGGMASDRVGFQPLDENGKPDARRASWVNRDDLVGVEQRNSDRGYDRIIMNPPFSKGRDIQHVRHAYDLLRPGGRLVAIMGEGAFFHSNKSAEDFRAWLDERGATNEKLPDGSFMDPALPVNTGVNARMVVIDKPAATPISEGDAPAGVRPDRTRTASPTDRAVMGMVREGAKAHDILSVVSGTSRNLFRRKIARMLIESGVTPSVVLEQGALGGGDGFTFLAKYSREADAITMTPGAESRAEQIFMHEMMHAATLRALDRNGLASLQLRRLYQHVKKQGGRGGSTA
ncbi:hypothetical protein [Ottowia sp. VDI28]|uniref:hypothetical protein n=1 Tax=Ottowia sp. VDI28 TaxID=3133968 RepID=UPI003C2BD7C9